MFPKHICSSEKIDCVALSRSRLGASTRGFELVAHRSTDRIAFIDGRNIENKMYWQGLSGDGLTIR